MTEERQHSPAAPHTPFHRLYLLAAAFLAGASIMIIELTGNRVLAPWFGNSLYTWTGLIGVILVSISCGYYLGGYLADRRPGYVVLAHILACSALLTLLIPLAPERLVARLASLGIVLGPLAASLLLFALPGCLLGAVPPFCIRLTSLLSGDRKVGVSAGTIGMISTLASVIGTFLSGFVLIPLMDLRHIFVAVGLMLGALSIVGYCAFLREHRSAIPLAAFVVLLAIALPSASRRTLPENVLFDETSFYHRIRVAERSLHGKKARIMIHDTAAQGGEFLKSGEPVFLFSRYWELATIFCPTLDRALFLGGGSFTAPRALLEAKPGASVDVVEIDPAVIRAARQLFGIARYPGLHSIAMDARRYLLSSSKRYDLILGDVFQGVRSIPPHLVTGEFFELVHDHLTQNGIYMMNIISAIQGPDARLFGAVTRTLSRTFGQVHAFATYPNELGSSQNVILVAASSKIDISGMLEHPERLAPSVAELLKTFIDPDRYDLSGSPVLTDNRNPIDLLVARRRR